MEGKSLASPCSNQTSPILFQSGPPASVTVFVRRTELCELTPSPRSAFWARSPAFYRPLGEGAREAPLGPGTLLGRLPHCRLRERLIPAGGRGG